MAILRRAIEPLVMDALADTPVVVVNGARQVGKTTLIQALPYPGSHEFVTLDDEATREAAQLDPRGFLMRPVDTVVIDEAQLEPGLFRAIKAEVDRDRRPGRFLLTGSSQLLAAPDMAASLVGRVEIIDLWPFSQGELAAQPERFVDTIFEHPVHLLRRDELDRADLMDRIFTGGYPEAVRRQRNRRPDWFRGYLRTSTQSVIRDLAAIEHLAEIPRLLQMCAARTSTELNVTSIANELGVAERTTRGYLALLATAFLVQTVPAWSTNLSKKVVRRPKLTLNDSGLAAHLIGVSPSTAPQRGGPIGQLLETFVTNELSKQLAWSTNKPSIWHFRDRSGVEVDLVLEHPDGRIVGIEVKATSTPRGSDLRGLRFLADRLGDRFHYGVLLSAAPEATPFGPKLAALPVSALWAAR